MNQLQSLKWKFEAVSWLIIILLIIAFLFPILSKVDNFPFLFYNILFIAVFFHFTKYIFLLKFVPFSHQQRTKLALIFLSIPLLMLLFNGVGEFQAYADEIGLQSIVNSLPNVDSNSLIRYIKTEMLFFGVSSIIAAVLFPIRLIISIWRVRNSNRT